MPSTHKIEALIEVADTLAQIEVIFTSREEADKAVAFLKNVEGLMKLEHAEIQPMTFEDFKDRLGERFDIIEKDRPLRKMTAANAVPA
jgi:uncharacterized protein YfcZ (UPF0381/DUF406 family)